VLIILHAAVITSHNLHFIDPEVCIKKIFSQQLLLCLLLLSVKTVLTHL